MIKEYQALLLQFRDELEISQIGLEEVQIVGENTIEFIINNLIYRLTIEEVGKL